MVMLGHVGHVCSEQAEDGGTGGMEIIFKSEFVFLTLCAYQVESCGRKEQRKLS